MPTSFAIADEIINLRPSSNRRVEIKDIRDRLAKRKDSQCLVVFADPYPVLYRYSHPKNGKSVCEEILTGVPIGDEWNPASYWLMRFHHNGLSCAQLARLGATIVVGASHLSSGSIRGLEGLTCSMIDGIRPWTVHESAQLEDEIKNLEEGLGRSILGP